MAQVEAAMRAFDVAERTQHARYPVSWIATFNEVLVAAHDARPERKQVGWYCSGGHLDPHGKMVKGESFRPDDPCEFSVPLYIEVEGT